MLLLVPLLVAAVLAPLLGGDLSRLSSVRFRHVWLLLAALATQVWLIARPGPQTPFLTALELGAYPLAFGFLYVNRRIPGAAPIALGAASNFLAIAANGGVMPAARSAVIIAGLPLDYHGIYANSEAIANPRLLWLGDVFPIPSAVPLATVFSVGDILIAFGAAYAILRITLRGRSRSGEHPPEVREQDAASSSAETPAVRAGS
jgi:hypothetical protein